MTRRPMPLLMLAVMSLGLVTAWPARAQPEADPAGLASLIPGDAVAAVYWAGMNDATPGYAGSRLEAVLADSGLGRRINEAVAATLERGDRGDRGVPTGVARAMEAWRELGDVVWKREWTVYFQGVNWPERDARTKIKPAVVQDGRVVFMADEDVMRETPLPRLGFVIEPGEDAAVVREYLAKLADEMRRSIPGLTLEVLDDGRRMGLLLNTQLEADPAESLPQREGFGLPAGAIAPRSKVVWLYADAPAVDDLIRDGMQHAGEVDGLARYERAVEAVRLEGLGQVFYAAGFDGTDWMQELFIAAPAPRQGLLTLLDRPAIEFDQLAGIPAAATWVRVATLDLGNAWDTLHRLVGDIDADAGASLDKGIASLNDAAGFDVRQDLVGALGDTWLFYAEPGFGGTFGTGVVMVNQPRDPDTLNASLLKLQAMLNDQLRQNNAGFTFNSLEQDGYTLHAMAAPFVSPAWAVADGRWYLGLTPQAVQVARASAADPGKPLVDDPDFAAMGERLVGPEGPDEPDAFMFTRVEQSAPALHAGWSTLAGLAPMAGADLPFDVSSLVPPLGTLDPHLGNAVAAGWTDDAGYHSRSISPFPGSMLLSQDFVYHALTSGVVAAPLLLPALSDARAAARDTASLSNARQIGVAMIVYADAHGGQLPPDLGTLFAAGIFRDPSVFFHPADPALDGADPVAVADLPAYINRHSSYVFVRPNVKFDTFETPSKAILLVDISGASDRVAVLFADGHSEQWQGLGRAAEAVQEQTGQSLDQWQAARE